MSKDIEREAFEDWYCKHHTGLKQSDLYKFRTLSGYSFSDSLKINVSWEAWQAAKAHDAEKLKGCVVVSKDQTEDWYLDDNANMWITEPDEWLCDLYVGEVQSVEHKEYLITKSDTLYAAIVWDDENQDSGTWEFFKTEEEAEKAAAHCKAMLEAARGGNEH